MTAARLIFGTMAAAAAARVKSRRSPRPTVLDVAASALVHVLPRRLEPLISQAHRDARSVLDGLRGQRGSAFSTREAPTVSPLMLREIDPVAEVLPRPIAERYEVLRRDLAMVGGELRGNRPPMLVSRVRVPVARSRYASPAASALQTRTFRVLQVIDETTDARTFELADTSGVPFHFEAGQFLTLHVELDGRSLRRAYSISSSPGASGRVRITVKRIEGGLVSRHLVETVREGEVLRAHGPSGSFVVPRGQTGRHLLLFAGGSGITPVASILRDVIAHEPATRVSLVYGNRSEADAIFRTELDALSARHPGRLRIVHVLAEPATDAPCVRGIPDREVTGRLLDEEALLRAREGEEAVRVFSCGPSPMMAAVRDALSSRGLPPERLVEERFLSPADPRTAPRATAPQLVRIRSREGVREVSVAPGHTVLEAALAVGVALPFSCQMGGCGACRVKGEGALTMDEPNCLGAAERADGMVLTCVARALGPAVLDLPGVRGDSR